ncbi:DNA-binding protein RFXANK-like isoform X2 [Bacillus rossius redtenbacheri]|uniref:DNA-binding protein RFXANK-like isoform X2 n=1 Tax=Bacillus rossius redtenbacheri TaxID=93214 RepID=UPI002FDD438C
MSEDERKPVRPELFNEDTCCNLLKVKSEVELRGSPARDDAPVKMRWSPGSWQDGTRRSAFQPYRPTTVLTNLQRGNIPTEAVVPTEGDASFHHRAGQGNLTQQDIESEPDVDAPDAHRLSALMWASAYGQVPTVQRLLGRGAGAGRRGPEGETALLLAAAGGHLDVLRALLAEGAAVDLVDDVGNTALMYAAHGNHPHCTNELLLRGADFTVTNHNQDTAYSIAVKRKSRLVSY